MYESVTPTKPRSTDLKYLAADIHGSITKVLDTYPLSVLTVCQLNASHGSATHLILTSLAGRLCSPHFVWKKLRLRGVRSITHTQRHLTPKLLKLITSFQRASTTYKSWKLLTKIIAKDGTVRCCSFISAKSITRLMTT